MELMQLEMFVAVVEERSFVRAAERVFRTQPAVSIGLRKLEGRIGVPLLDRSHRRSGRLTPAGEVLYEYASRILGLRDEALSILKEDCSSVGNLRVGVTSGENFEWIPQLTVSFNNQYPNIRLEILCDRPVNLFRDLTERRMHLALLSGRPKSDVQNKNFIVTRVKGIRPHASFWVVRRKLGRSPLAYAFEHNLMRYFQSSTGTRTPKKIDVRSLSADITSLTNRHVCADNSSQ